jgi:hypothetical protein
MTHLHGSVSFGYGSKKQRASKEREERAIVKHHTAEAATQSLLDPPNPRYTDDAIDEASPIISGANKVLKFTVPPYSYYYAALQQTLQKSKRILSIGYGFSDPHVNNWIDEAVAHHGEKQTRLAVVDHCADANNWMLEKRTRFVAIKQKLSVGPLDLSDASVREFSSSGGICVTLNAYPPREDLLLRIVSFLLRD